MGSKIKQDLVVGLFIYALLAAFFYQTTFMHADSAVFPRMILGVFCLLNTFMVIGAFNKPQQAAISFHAVAKPVLYFLGIVLYAVLFRIIGYFPSTLILLIAFMAIFKVRPWWKITIISIGYLSFIYVLFVMWLKVPMV